MSPNSVNMPKTNASKSKKGGSNSTKPVPRKRVGRPAGSKSRNYPTVGNTSILRRSSRASSAVALTSLGPSIVSPLPPFNRVDISGYINTNNNDTNTNANHHPLQQSSPAAAEPIVPAYVPACKRKPLSPIKQSMNAAPQRLFLSVNTKSSSDNIPSTQCLGVAHGNSGCILPYAAKSFRHSASELLSMSKERDHGMERFRASFLSGNSNLVLPLGGIVVRKMTDGSGYIL